ncbi:DNA polymerase III subunit delta [Glaciecola siphonariae]|uniref:DNA polymerase III subunit delta n=1 Tax=Glaciecola siphonariae TaxID=521012 RepID=A0ABV9LRG8_9ALTE
MQLKPNQFEAHLSRNPLPSIVLLFGDEPQQKQDVIDALRKQAKLAGFEERQTLVADGDFSWQQLIDATQAMSLFSDKQYIELTLPTGKPGTQGAAVLSELSTSLTEDTLLLIQGPKIGKDVQNTKWFKQLLSHAWFCHCYELQGGQLQQWVKQRAAQAKLPLTQDAISLIADMNEGNLLAANQELEKLALLFVNETSIDASHVARSSVDQSRFTVFQFTDEVLSGNMRRAIKILYRLESEGLEPNIILWSLIKEAQLLEQCQSFRQRGESIPFAKMRIWQNKQALYNAALMRLSAGHLSVLIGHLQQADALLKSETLHKPYVMLSHLALLFLPAPLEHFSLSA